MCSRRVCIALLACVLVEGGWGLSGTALAQHKAAAPVKGEMDTEAQVKDKSKSLWIRKVDWRTTASKLRAPEYVFKNVLQSAPKTVSEWHQIVVNYDSAPEWMDRIVVNYHVLLLNDKKGYGGEPAKAAAKVVAKSDTKEPEEKEPPYTLLEGTVYYVDVKKGQGHLSAMFIRPNTIERYGSPVAVGIEIVSGDETIVKNEYSPLSKISSDAKQMGKWWTVVSKSEAVSVRTDCLFNRSQTPFVLVNYQEEEAIQ